MDVVAGLIALIHVYVFVMESLLWGRERTNRVFGMSAADARTTRGLAFNQGFYNLFLSIAIAAGFVLMRADRVLEGRILVDYAVLSVFGAGAVLLASERRLWRPALIQALPAALYFVLRAF